MKFALIRDTKHEQFLTVTGEGITMYYYEVFKVGSNFIKRRHGEVNGISFSTNEEGYYKKNGRGRIKNEAEVWEKIRNADSFIYEQGFSFWKD